METGFIDSHAHFDTSMEKCGLDENTLFGNMRAANVTHALQISTEVEDFDWCVEFARKHENIRFTLGVHPTSKYDSKTAEILDARVDQVMNSDDKRRFSGIGEVGLDYHWNKENSHEQILFFEQCVAIAQKYSVPLIIHSRDAFDDTYSVIQKANLSKVILHCFTGDLAQARRFLDLGCYLSFAGNVTYKNAKGIQEAAAFVPADRILLETDCPYLTPVPFRGQMNQPANVAHVYQFVSVLRNEPIDSLSRSISDNYFTIFER